MTGVGPRSVENAPTDRVSLTRATPLGAEPIDSCIADGQPMTPLGVLHSVDCGWLAWFRSWGGCMGDV